MDAKLNSKTHVQNKVFNFEPFRARLASKFSKSFKNKFCAKFEKGL
jgi:hypothetical protein